MKNHSIFTLILLLISSYAYSQNNKIGYVDLDVVFINMPEMKEADSLVSAYEDQLQENLSAKYQDYQIKLEKYQANQELMDEVLKNDAEKELQNMQAQLEEFRSNANQAIGQKRQKLLSPLRQKVKEAINNIAEVNSYSHVFSTDGSLVYVRDETDDLSERIAEELGFDLNKNP